MGRVIAIDGPSGAGKSTVAKMVSEITGFGYLDTGALYRAVALGLRNQAIGTEDSDGVIEEALGKITVSFEDAVVFLNGRDVSAEIRTPEMGHYSSVFSARRPVREFLLPVQRQAAESSDLVTEGRDMTTVIFPDAWIKVYLDASVGARAKRRYLQLRQSGVHISMDDARRDVEERDKRDSSRSLAPLRIAEDAVYIDSSEMDVEAVIKKVLDIVRQEEEGT